jgi:predicted secreted protein
MATTGAFAGKNLLLYLAGTAVALTKECSINVSSDEIDITSKDSNFAFSMLPGQVKVTISCNYLATVVPTTGNMAKLMAAIKAGTAFAWKVTTNTTGDNYLHGAAAYLTGSNISASMNDAVSGDFNLTVSGVWNISAKT